MSSRIRWSLVGAGALPAALALFAVAAYVGAFYPQPFPPSLNARLIQIAPPALLPFIFGGAWMGAKLSGLTRAQKTQVLATSAIFLIVNLALFCACERAGISPSDSLRRQALGFTISTASLVICLLISAKLARAKEEK